LKKISKDFPENYSKAKVEYQELHSIIKESVISENVITKLELENIKKEF